MSENKQSIYEYKAGKRIRNLGFLRIESSFDKCVLHVYGKDIDEIKGIIFQNTEGDKYIGSWEDDEVMETEEYVYPSNMFCEKISRQELSRLPRKDWRIANNSFLLHGFYNYHHLLYIEDGEEVWIGVPGIFHEKEKMAAKAFGFSEFRRIADVDVELEERETNTVEDFGYWCRQIAIPKV